MARLSLALSKYEFAIGKLQNEFADDLHMKDDILKLFPPRIVVHSGTTRLVSKPNILDRTPKLHKTNFSVDPNMLLQTDALKFRDVLFKVHASLQEQQKRHTVEIMLETGDAAGHSVDGKGRNFWDAHIETLQRMPYQEHGYKLYMNPETEKKIRETPPTEEQLQKMRKVIRAKREEYFAKKRFRRLS